MLWDAVHLHLYRTAHHLHLSDEQGVVLVTHQRRLLLALWLGDMSAWCMLPDLPRAT